MYILFFIIFMVTRTLSTPHSYVVNVIVHNYKYIY